MQCLNGAAVGGNGAVQEIRGAYQAWKFIDGALQSEADISILKRCKSPREAFDHFEKWYDPENEVATQKLFDKFHNFTIPPNSNPIEAPHALEDTNSHMAEKGMGVPDTFLHARFVRALPDEYGHIKATLQAMKNRDRAEIIRMVGTRYPTLPQKKGPQRSSRPPAHAFFSSESGGRRGARRGRDRVHGGAQGRGRGESSSKDGGRRSRGGSSSVVVPAVVVTVTVADLLAAVGDGTGEATSGRRAPRRRSTSSPSMMLVPRVLTTRRAHAHRTRRCCRWSC